MLTFLCCMIDFLNINCLWSCSRIVLSRTLPLQVKSCKIGAFALHLRPLSSRQERSLSCHTRSDTGFRILRSHTKDCSLRQVRGTEDLFWGPVIYSIETFKQYVSNQSINQLIIMSYTVEFSSLFNASIASSTCNSN